MAFLWGEKSGELLARWAEHRKTLQNITRDAADIPGLRPSLDQRLGLRPGQLAASHIFAQNKIALQVLPSKGTDSIRFS